MSLNIHINTQEHSSMHTHTTPHTHTHTVSYKTVTATIDLEGGLVAKVLTVHTYLTYFPHTYRKTCAMCRGGIL